MTCWRCYGVCCMCRSSWGYMLDLVFGEDWEARRDFVERRLS